MLPEVRQGQLPDPAQDTDAAGGPLVDHICYTIADWDKDAIEAELRRRGLNPEPDTDESFHVRDPDGYRLHIGSARLMYVP